ncbi:putative ferric-chelate reductase 1 [Erpetoichthys calabaricus]|uniref:Zgc:163022 n=1 Tax=Erpetoichthys calabaricus TaxID=27687 RepID=A0A8C4T309_ERPCA|nr:putative ferric-chelate reductase 1 [Erpetoichthys calabaricus]
MQKQCFLVFLLVHGVTAYSSGLLLDACNTMLPLHDSVAQISPPPYEITTDKSSYSPGDEIKVTIRGLTHPFKGFLLEAWQDGIRNAVGSFAEPNSGDQFQGLQCNGVPNSAVSHTDKLDKTQVQIAWISPTSPLGNIEFRATLVENKTTFWENVTSALVHQVARDNSSPNSASFSSLSDQINFEGFSSRAAFLSSDGCGTVKFCFTNPDGCDPSTDSSCYFMSSTALQNGTDGFQFEISGSSNGYVAIGFSDDQIMGNDDIYACVLNSEVVGIQHAYSIGETQLTPLLLGNVSNITTSYSGGVIQCSFISKNVISTQQRVANSYYYIFLAFGPSSNGVIQQHPQTPFISPNKIDLLSTQSLSGSESNPPIIKTHGALMLISWMTTGSIGILIARFCKHVVKGKRILGKDLWFQAHVFLMLLTVAATITAFVLAFVSSGDWSGGAHPVLGCIVMGLALIQPLGAIFRCAPDNNRRFIFNILHACNALVIKVLAVAAIFLGLELLDSTNTWMRKVMGGFVGWEFLIFIILDVKAFMQRREIYANVSQMLVEPVILIIYIAGNLMFLIALLVGIGQT